MKENMKIAVACDFYNKEVFQHFERTEYFSVYQIEDNDIRSIEEVYIIKNSTGYEQLVDFLTGKKVDVLICGKIGADAQAALEEAGIELVAGAGGNPDEVVKTYLRAENECVSQTEVKGKNVGKICRVRYIGTFNDGVQFDSSDRWGESMEYICGYSIFTNKGFDAAVANMEVGQIVDIHLMPEEAYGLSDPDAIMTFEIAQLKGAEKLKVGYNVFLTSSRGELSMFRVTAKDDRMITLDGNYRLAGKELNYRIELLEVR